MFSLLWRATGTGITAAWLVAFGAAMTHSGETEKQSAVQAVFQLP